MKCKEKGCEKPSGHAGRCGTVTVTEPAVTETTQAVTVTHCAECDRLRAEIKRLKPSRAEYMRKRRAKQKAGFIGIAYG